MDYEKKYNEALERAKELLLGNEHSNTIRSYFEHIFPELRESDDERIRKGLVKLLTVASEAYLVESTGIKKDSYLSYLEKQKEPKQTDLPAGFYVTLDGKKYYTKEMRCNNMKVKVVTPQPPSWSEEDTEMYINVASSLRGYACGLENEEHKRHIKKGLDWLENRFKSLRPCPSWKPSEEQMEALNYAIAEWDGGKRLEGLYTLRNDLKKL